MIIFKNLFWGIAIKVLLSYEFFELQEYKGLVLKN